MVDAQTVGVLVTAASVTVAAFYYIYNLRVSNRMSRITFTNSILQSRIIKEEMKVYVELLNDSWDSYQDYLKKYGEGNSEGWARSRAWFYFYDTLGYLLMDKVVDNRTLYTGGGGGIAVIRLWTKFSPIFREMRATGSEDYMKGFEYLFYEIARMRDRLDPSFERNNPASYSLYKSGEYEAPFSK
ncbi:MAG: hypothetical protein ABSA11_15110 [Candidatus Bathyarchaeia archaeon]